MIEGSCHCGNIKWSYPLLLESVTACNCSLCSRYGALWIYGHIEDGITISGETKAYMRDAKINGFHFCTTCGCLAYYLSNSRNKDGQLRVALNLRMISDPTPIMHLPIDHFDGKDTFEDLPRDHRQVHDLWY